jgi:tetratricopeptide (TPR) repeat protein
VGASMKKLILSMLFSLILLSLSSTAFAKESVSYQTQSVKFSGGTRSVNTVYVNMNDKNIRVEEQVAKNQVGQTDNFKNIVIQAKDSNTEVLAAINGTFFNSYSDMKPSGTIQSYGRFYHIGNDGSVIAFSSDNKVSVEPMRAAIKGTINEQPDCWYAWNINSMNDAKDSIIIFDPAFGKTTPKHDRTSIVIDDRKVIAINKGQVSIPTNGYVIVLKSTFYIKKFHIGDKVDYVIETSKATSPSQKTPIDWTNIVTSVGAGPTLLKNGVILANGKSEGFAEAKININRNQRSFAGVTKDNILIIGTVSNVNVKELAEICKKLGMVDAINLDGGASSALYYKDKIVTSPGRKLSNVMVITRVKTIPLKYSFNGKEIVSSNNIYVDTASKELMVPLRDTCRQLFADFSIRDTAITIKRFTKTISLKVGSSSVIIDGDTVSLKAAPVSKNGILYVPVQAFIEALGGSVKYDTAKSMYCVNITNYNIPTLFKQAANANKQKDYETAKKLYNQILSLDPQFSKAYYSLGYIYSAENNRDEAIKNFLEYLKYNPEDAAIMTSIAWAYEGKKDTPKAIEYFTKSLTLEPTNVSRWITLGQLYMRSNIAQYSNALACFNNAAKNNPNSEQREQIKKLINDCKKRMGE